MLAVLITQLLYLPFPCEVLGADARARKDVNALKFAA
jgi:hypothetical protein